MIIFGILFATGIVTCILPVSITKIHHLPAFSYITLILIWAVSIRRRIVDDRIRRRILAACLFMVFLFFLRMCKFSYFPDDVYINEYLWYGYTIPLTTIPMCFFLASLYVEPVRDEKLIGTAEKSLIIANIVISVIAMTNSFHSFVYRITVHPDKEYTHEWFYWVIIVFRLALSVGVLLVVYRKCSLSAAKRKWYLPVICLTTGCFLLGWYLVNGGSPKIMGYKLFQLHEAVCIPFILAFESLIQVGMIPANSGYGDLFDHSGINARIYDEKDRPVIVSGNRQEEASDDEHRLQKEPISGGYVTWVEDLSLINSLNREIEEVTEELGDENELIRKENEIRSERIAFEERNRLYNRIAKAVRTRAVRSDSLLSQALGSTLEDDGLRGQIVYASVLGAYIKRMGNLMLLTDGVGALSSAELASSIRESFDYLKLNGCQCLLEENTRCYLGSQAALLAYELFEDAVEDVWLRLHAVSVSINREDDFVMMISMDAPAEAISPAWKDKELKAADCSLSVKYEDETYYIRFTTPVTSEKTAEKAAEKGAGTGVEKAAEGAEKGTPKKEADV